MNNIVIALTLEPRHLEGAGSRLDPTRSAVCSLFNELSGVERTINCNKYILLHSKTEEYRLISPNNLAWQERELYETSTFTNYSFTVTIPQWTYPEYVVKQREVEPLVPIKELIKTWWKGPNDI